MVHTYIYDYQFHLLQQIQQAEAEAKHLIYLGEEKLRFVEHLKNIKERLDTGVESIQDYEARLREEENNV